MATPESEFISFLQERFGEEVSVPKQATDVMRITRFPGLESKRRNGDKGMLDFPAAAPPQMSQEEPMGVGAPTTEPEFPEGF